jgi:hypothetical protein
MARNMWGVAHVLVMFFYLYLRPSPLATDMEREISLLKRNIARIRRDIRIQASEMQTLVDFDLDCSGATRVLMHLENDLRLYLDKLERLTARERA